MELKSCPFCGGTAKISEINGAGKKFYSVSCRCGAGTRVFHNTEAAEQCWNRRDDFGWIPVTNALPETDDRVIVSVIKIRTGKIDWYKARYQDGEWKGVGSASEVLAWKNVRPYIPPEEPEEKGEDSEEDDFPYEILEETTDTEEETAVPGTEEEAAVPEAEGEMVVSEAEEEATVPETEEETAEDAQTNTRQTHDSAKIAEE